MTDKLHALYQEFEEFGKSLELKGLEKPRRDIDCALAGATSGEILNDLENVLLELRDEVSSIGNEYVLRVNRLLDGIDHEYRSVGRRRRNR